MVEWRQASEGVKGAWYPPGNLYVAARAEVPDPQLRRGRVARASEILGMPQNLHRPGS